MARNLQHEDVRPWIVSLAADHNPAYDLLGPGRQGRVLGSTAEDNPTFGPQRAVSKDR